MTAVTRIMYDAAAVNADRIPADAAYVAGGPQWTDAQWSLFPAAVHVHIAIDPADITAEVLDIERKYVWSPDNPVIGEWLTQRRAMGYRGTLYVWQGNLAGLRAAVDPGFPGVLYWVADATGSEHVLSGPGIVATQWCNYANGPIPGVDQTVISSSSWLTPYS